MSVKVPYYIANYIAYCKENKLTILGAFDPVGDFGEALFPKFKGDTQKCLRWIKKNSNKFASAWVNGYYPIEPIKYIVRVNNVKPSASVLKYQIEEKHWVLGNYCLVDNSARRVKHTKQELIEAGFDWVFFCDGVTVEEVYEDL